MLPIIPIFGWGRGAFDAVMSEEVKKMKTREIVSALRRAKRKIKWMLVIMACSALGLIIVAGSSRAPYVKEFQFIKTVVGDRTCIFFLLVGAISAMACFATNDEVEIYEKEFSKRRNKNDDEGLVTKEEYLRSHVNHWRMLLGLIVGVGLPLGIICSMLYFKFEFSTLDIILAIVVIFFIIIFSSCFSIRMQDKHVGRVEKEYEEKYGKGECENV